MMIVCCSDRRFWLRARDASEPKEPKDQAKSLQGFFDSTLSRFAHAMVQCKLEKGSAKGGVIGGGPSEERLRSSRGHARCCDRVAARVGFADGNCGMGELE